MPCWIRKVAGDHFENFVEIAAEEWKLREQVQALEAWLGENTGQLDTQHHWVADIGFEPTPGASSLLKKSRG